MTYTLIELTEDEFDKQYPLVPNHLNRTASWLYGDGPGCLFETYGEELAFVRQQHPSTIWTFLDGDDGDQYLVSGFHFVNRIGYLVSTVEVPEGVDIEVRIPIQTDPSDEPQEPEAARGPTNHRLAEIAREHLGIPTLDVRNSDSLDFHNVAVWQIMSALQAAFEAGATAGIFATQSPGLPVPFDAYEIHGMKRLPCNGQEEEPIGRVIGNCEPVPDEQAEFWSLFGHIPGQGIDCIGDFATRQDADEIFARITGRAYSP